MRTNTKSQDFTKVHELTQFELSKDVLMNQLKNYKLSSTGKLVLLYLTACFNPNNGNVVFPKLQTIADSLGIGLTATKSAISDLINEGLVIKTKQNKAGNSNKYLLTGKVTGNGGKNRTFKQPKSELLKGQNPTISCKRTNKRTKKSSNREEGNKKPSYTEEELKIIKEYVSSRSDIKDKIAYYNKIISCDCTFILKKYAQEKAVKMQAEREIQRTQEYLKELRENRKNASSEIPESFKKLKGKLSKK